MLNVKRKRPAQTTLDKYIKRSRVSEMEDTGNSTMTDLVEASLTDIAPPPESNAGESSTMTKEAENIDLKIVIDNDDDGACSDSSIEIVKVVKPGLDSRNADADSNDEMTSEGGYRIVLGNNSQESAEDTDHVEEHSSDTNIENNVDKQEDGLKILNSQGQDCLDVSQDVEMSQEEEEDEIKRYQREARGISLGEQLKEFQVRISEKDKNNSAMFLDEKTKDNLVRLWLQTRDENVQERWKVKIKDLEDCLKTMFIKTKCAVTGREDMPVLEAKEDFNQLQQQTKCAVTGREDMQVLEAKEDFNQLQQPENEVVLSKAVDESSSVDNAKESPVNVETMPIFLQNVFKNIKIGKVDDGKSSTANSKEDKDTVENESYAASLKEEQDTVDKKSSAAISEQDKDMPSKESYAASLKEDQDTVDKKSSPAISEGDKDTLSEESSPAISEDKDTVDRELSIAGSKKDGELSLASSKVEIEGIYRELPEQNLKAEDKHPVDAELCATSSKEDEDIVDKKSCATSLKEDEDIVDKESCTTSLKEDEDIVNKELSATSLKEDEDVVDKELSATSLKEDEDIVNKELSATSLKEDEDIVDKELSATSLKEDEDIVDKKSCATSLKEDEDIVDKEPCATSLKEDEDIVDKELSATSLKEDEDIVDKELSATSLKEEEDVVDKELSATSLKEDEDVVDKESSATSLKEDEDIVDKELSATSLKEDEDIVDKESSATSLKEDEDIVNKELSATSLKEEEDIVDKELSATSLKEDEDIVNKELSATSLKEDEDIVNKKSCTTSLKEDEDIVDKELSATSLKEDEDIVDKQSCTTSLKEDEDIVDKESCAASLKEDEDIVDKKSCTTSLKEDEDIVDKELSATSLKEDEDIVDKQSCTTSLKEDEDIVDKESCAASLKDDEDIVDKESCAASLKEDEDIVDKESCAASLKEDEDIVDKESCATSLKEDEDIVNKELSATSLKEEEDIIDKESCAASLKEEEDIIDKESCAASLKEDEDIVDKESCAPSLKDDEDVVDKQSCAASLKEDEDIVDKESCAASLKEDEDIVDKESCATSSKAGAKDMKTDEIVKMEDTDSEENTQEYQLLREKEVENQVGLRLGPDFETFLRAPHCCTSEQHRLRANHEHIVLCLYRDPSKPFPREYRDCWDNENVRMPCSPRNKHEVKDVGLVSRWEVIRDAFSLPIATSYDLEKAILSYNTRKWSFRLLHVFVIENLSPEEQENFFQSTLPGIIRMALSLPEVVTKPPPLLKGGKDMTITMSQYQAAVLLSCAFLCMFPRRNSSNGANDEYHHYPSINFSGLFRLENNRPISRKIEKLKCILHYFKRVVEKTPHGKISFKRQVMDHKCKKPEWHASCKKLCRLRISSDGTIEDSAPGMLQVDFANERVGGGVLGSGCVQEEIRFVICPELIVARLFTERLQENECLIVTGAERFSDYVGYGDTFKWAGNHEDQTPRDHWGRLHTEIVAIDALRQTRYVNQYDVHSVRRELNKAYIGFHSKDIESPQNLPAVATGNWGCGAFGGDRELKSLIQIMAASMANREMIYFTFNDKEFAENLFEVHSLLKGTRCNIKELWKMICKYRKVLNDEPTRTLFEFFHEWLKAREHYGQDSVGNKV